jgi:SAM-dependent methyltransferase
MGKRDTEKKRPLLAAAKRGAETLLWTRVAVQRMLSPVQRRQLPRPAPECGLLLNAEQWQSAVSEVRKLGLPLHHDRIKNWDALGALSHLVRATDRDAAILDAGAARYSTILPWLRLYGYSRLFGINLEFKKQSRHGPVQFLPGDITATKFESGSFGAITCMSVIEHGVPTQSFLAEAARLLQPGGSLVISTDYDQEPPDTTGKFAYGVPVKIFSPAGIHELVSAAAEQGLSLQGELQLNHAERPVYWRRMNLSYTFIRLTFTKV